MEQNHVTIVGAGIVGISIALELQTQGFKVRVLDRSGVANEASAGSAGAFAFADIVPLATPGIMLKAPKWLLDPLGPLSVPPAYAVKIAPWMLRFWRASWRDRYQAALAAQSTLNGFSSTALERQIKNVDGEPLMQRDGQMQLYEGEQEFRASLKSWEVRRAFGIAFEHLKSPEEIAEIQPGLDPRFTHAAFTPDWMNTIDPRSWAEHLAQAFKTRGGEIERVEVLALEQSGDGFELMTPNGPLKASQVVVAAGAWSHHLARTLGDRIPLETERGYNTTLPAGAFDLRTQLTFGGHGFVASRINGGVRIGGAVELGGLKLPPNFKRAEILLKKAAQFLPTLNTADGKQWMGFRPSMPDSLPVIGASPRASKVIYAFGHGHLGLTQSAGTAELVAALICGKTPAVSTAPYAPTRF
ncbi:NAD(P)/FAD-dependent oxidoreductase [Pacificibacter marinus]|uniref:D-amino acid dehydrogenase small subunit n=1 Tax=Pacificibacter marinus TaxID=658057 RepID=A0A1Y5RXK5_9RHOB|nr:FAD-binding oxidoreductase [Pacificibacter marinus]SEK40326.1 D-amino-acid dehydrogenase [Pacificibacter marinus]SLN25300.1 D-amino acid dehydrogenase small subunit [Pacificibacter marinus]